ncbi:MAG TPA: hypothetical protein VF260_01530 [Bacilli bacterium]
MAEKNILAYFNTPEEAEAVKRKLESLRASALSIRKVAKFPGDGVERIMNPITGDIPSLASLTLAADITNKSAGILTAADAGASGMSDGGQGMPTGRNILLTAVIAEEHFHQALRVIEAGGGKI